MASTGKTAWGKYFQGRGNLPTTMKKEAGTYDVETGKSKIGTIKAGEKITYLETKEYEQRALVKYGKTYVRVPFDSIAKPGVKASGAVSLKPQAFGVRDNKYVYKDYVKLVSESIEERKDLSAPLRTYLAALFDYYSGGKMTQAKLKKIFSEVKDSIPVNDINKDFGEVVGPVACVTKKLLANKKVKLTKTCKIYMPERPNEPLMDYGIFQGDKQYTISAKSGKTTNVVKPGDIINLLAINPAKVRKWKNKKEYKLLQMLSDSSIINGAPRAIAAMYPKLIDMDSATSMTKQKYNSDGFANFIKTNAYLSKRKKITSNEIMYECEKMIQQETKSGKLNMNAIFADAIEEQVLYIKFEVGEGDGKWGVIAADDIKVINSYGRAYLRTKNGYTRAADRMGVQI
jgi:hypothetical protein